MFIHPRLDLLAVVYSQESRAALIVGAFDGLWRSFRQSVIHWPCPEFLSQFVLSSGDGQTIEAGQTHGTQTCQRRPLPCRCPTRWAIAAFDECAAWFAAKKWPASLAFGEIKGAMSSTSAVNRSKHSLKCPSQRSLLFCQLGAWMCCGWI